MYELIIGILVLGLIATCVWGVEYGAYDVDSLATVHEAIKLLESEFGEHGVISLILYADNWDIRIHALGMSSMFENIASGETEKDLLNWAQNILEARS